MTDINTKPKPLCVECDKPLIRARTNVCDECLEDIIFNPDQLILPEGRLTLAQDNPKANIFRQPTLEELNSMFDDK